MIKSIVKFLTNMLGGYASYALIAVGIYAGIQTWRVGSLKASKAKVETQRDAFKAASEGKDTTIRTQAETQARKAKAKEQGNDAEDKIRDTVDSNQCGSSEPFVAAFDWLHNNPDAKLDNDTADVGLRPGTKTSEQ